MVIMAVAETCLIITEGTVPAWSSSPAAPVPGQLADLAEGACDDPPGLLALLAKVTDPRRRGIRHRLVVILALAVCAVLAGARSFTTIAERAADEETLARPGVSGPVPSESTFRRTLQYLDADASGALAGEWTAQRAHAEYRHGRSAHYLLIVKRNQPSLYAQLAALPWRGVPVAYDKRERGHGRTERRTLTVSCVTPGSRTAACRRDAALRVVYASEHEDSARWPAGTATGPGRVGAVACR